MKILFVTPNPPSPIRVRPWSLAGSLQDQGHSLTLAHPLHGHDEALDSEILRERGFKTISRPLSKKGRLFDVVRAFLKGRPLQSGYSFSPDLMAAITTELERAESEDQPYDVVHVEHLRAAPYALYLQPSMPVVWDSVDCISQLFEQARKKAGMSRGRLIALLDLRRTRSYEAGLVHQFPFIAVTSETDRQGLLDLCSTVHNSRGDLDAKAAAKITIEAPNEAGVTRESPEVRRSSSLAAARAVSNVHVIPNGVDTIRFSAAKGPWPENRNPNRIVFSGKLSYHANLAAAKHLLEDIMPLVWDERPKTELVLAGAEAGPYLQSRASADSRISLTGWVDDLGVVLSSAQIAVAPMVYGVGIQNKVLEAMACATPVVVSKSGSQALAARSGEHLLCAGTKHEFANHVLSLLARPKEAETLGQSGRSWVHANHAWDTSARSFTKLYEQAIAAGQAPNSETKP